MPVLLLINNLQGYQQLAQSHYITSRWSAIKPAESNVCHCAVMTNFTFIYYTLTNHIKNTHQQRTLLFSIHVHLVNTEMDLEGKFRGV